MILRAHQVDGLSELTYSVTVRDFLPAFCLTREQLADLGIVDPIFKVPEGGLLEDCPYKAFRERGEVLGHPDFMRNPVTCPSYFDSKVLLPRPVAPIRLGHAVPF